jgi:RimJ/RimL family protein N-acetyltransferase/N-acetylglutamate synthase-like GNAT family acetyltransferase
VKLASEAEPVTGQPVGLRVNTPEAQRPGPVTLTGRHGRLEPLEPRHAADLWQASKDDVALWTYMGYGPFPDAERFTSWIAERATLPDPYAYAVIDAQGRAVGIVTLMEIRPTMGVIEVGHIVYTPALQQTRLATEVQYLLASYVFETLGYRRYEWKCNALNFPSRRAAERFGFTFEGIFRAHMIIKGRNRDTAWFSMLDDEWPQRKVAFEHWLAPDNFDEAGRQRTSLFVMNQLHAVEGDIRLRRAAPAEQAEIAAFTVEAFSTFDELTRRQSKIVASNIGVLLRDNEVWVVDGEQGLEAVVGLVIGKDAELMVTGVAAGAQARGLGEALLNFAQNRTRALGLPVLRILVNKNLTRQADWYARKGFARLDVVDTREELIHMAKTLT